MISIITPAFNAEQSIEQAIASVQGQSREDWELIIIDDGSTDATRSIAEAVSDRRIKVVWQKNAGVSAARNTGLGLARGDYITFLDADDTLPHNALNLHAATATAPNVVFWGRQPSYLLPGFLERADILLLAYLAEQHLDQLANPHKMMEYLAVGRCVLASRTLDYEDRPDLIEMASDQEEYAQRFAAITAEPAVWNSPPRVTQRRAFAADNTYTRQIDRIAQALSPRGHLIS